MQGIRNILIKQTSNPKSTSGTSVKPLILQENSFQFNGKNYLQIHGTAMGTKMAVVFANTFMSKVAQFDPSFGNDI